MKGIPFKSWKTKAISEQPDKEWQTRRLGGLKEINQEPDKWRLMPEWGLGWFKKSDNEGGEHKLLCKPRYQVGEVVYIKEAYNLDLWDERNIIEYKSDWLEWLAVKEFNDPSFIPQPVKWLSPLFMPAWAARYFIKILDARTERLQEITEDDAEKEGFNCWEYDNPNAYADSPCTNQFIRVWDSINPNFPFEGNYWVWVYSFKLVRKE